jgi:hypothetical protein
MITPHIVTRIYFPASSEEGVKSNFAQAIILCISKRPNVLQIVVACVLPVHYSCSKTEIMTRSYVVRGDYSPTGTEKHMGYL